MRLRTQILIFLLLFGLAPLLLAFAINIPLVFNSLELFYHKAHLQNLRADFRDLDQHIASLDFSANANDTIIIKMAQAFFAYVRDVTGDNLWTKLGLTNLNHVILDVDTGQFVVSDKTV